MIAMTGNDSDAFVALCTPSGEIRQVLRDDMALRSDGQTRLSDLVDPLSIEKLRSFLIDLQRERSLFGWEVELRSARGLRAVQLAGMTTGEDVLVAAASSTEQIRLACNALTALNNEQTNALRSALKDLATTRESVIREPEEAERNLLNELSRQNNELVTLQRELVRRNGDLARANALKTRFLGMASHDLRKPLSVVLLYIDMFVARHKEDIDSEDEEMVATVRESLGEMIDRIHDLLDIGQIDAGTFALRPGMVDLAGTTRDRVRVHRTFAGAKAITVEYDGPENSLVLQIDGPRIRQVIDNLLDNAIKFSPPGGTVKVRFIERSDEIRLEFHNDGPAIPSDQQAGIFDPFVRADVAPTGGESSTGLGLAICKAIIAGHDGAIGVRSVDGEGTTFHVTLPCAGMSAAA